MAKLYTAYNKDVQKYMLGNELSSKRKNTIIEHIEKMIIAAGESFERLFPARSKRKDVMDHIIYLLSGNGICKISAATLANKAGCSVRTVNAAVNALKKTGEVLVAGLADGKNKYVFILKPHENFHAILKDVFYINADQIAEQSAEHVAEQENFESLEAVSVEGEKTGSNNNNSLNDFNSLKQEKDIYRESIQNSIENELNDDNFHTYSVNENQKIMYDYIKAGAFHQKIKDNAPILSLRVGSNCNQNMLKHAIKAVIKIDRFLLNCGTITDSIPALFSRLYKDGINTSKTDLKPETSQSEGDVRSILYNWLEEYCFEVTAPVFEGNEESVTSEELNDLGVF